MPQHIPKEMMKTLLGKLYQFPVNRSPWVVATPQRQKAQS
jgi:hypothetical protein